MLDTLEDAVDPTTEASSLDATVVAAASLAEHYLRLGDRVAVHDLGSLVGPLPARAGARQHAALTARLAAVDTDGMVHGAFHRVAHLRPGTFAVVCSPLLDERVLTEIATVARRGATVLVVDTLPAALGSTDGWRARGGVWRHLLGSDAQSSLRAEAWVLRRLERDVAVAKLRDVGIPVAPWRGIDGVAALAASLAVQRPVVRTAGR